MSIFSLGHWHFIGKVQKHATTLVCELAKILYESRLKDIRIHSLYCRWQRGDFIETYKLLKSYYNLDWTGFFTLSPVQNTRGHHMKLYKKHSRLQLRENFFTQGVINMWNSLPETVVTASIVSIFKQKLDEYWNCIGYGYVQRPGA